MTPAVKSLTRDCTMSEAEKLFDQHDYNAFPVVEDGKLLGASDWSRSLLSASSLLGPR